MKSLTLAIDCDGVLANFSKRFSQLLRELHGHHLPLATEDDVKNWSWKEWYPLEQHQIDEGWEEINNHPTFWESLDIINPDNFYYFRNKLSNNPKFNVYFITTRSNTVGGSAAQQTANWLSKHGWKHPNVITTKTKGIVCNALEATHFIDDSGKNCLDVLNNSPNTQVYVQNRPHNEHMNFNEFENRTKRVHSITEFVDDVLEAHKNHV